MFARVLVCLDEGKWSSSAELSLSLLNETFPRHHYKSSIYAIGERGWPSWRWNQNEAAKIMS